MRGKIVHESRGRLRLRVAQKSLSLRQADLLEAWVKAQPWAVEAVVHERTGCLILRYTGDRAVALNALARFSWETAEETVSLPEHSLRELNRRFQEKNVAGCDAYYEADYASAGMGPSVNFINNLSLALISAFGALLYLFDGRFALTLGDLSSFVLYSRKFSGPINELANVISELQSALAAAERVFALLDAQPEAADAPDARELKVYDGKVEMNDIRFGYRPDREIIHGLSLKA